MAFFCIHCKSEVDPNFKACPFCGEAITEFLRRYLETPIDGKYQILSRLGIGGMGEVYKVLHVHLNAIRVIKLMRSNIASDPAAHERFLREARLATRINHPSVAALFDFSTLEDGSHYMVWEYIEGINLHEMLDERGPLSPRYAARLASQALMGLEAIHRAGIVHRDVSPENLMVTRDDEGEERVKIIDLGIAKQSGTDENNTKTGMFVGKWKYCSPEHLGMLPAGERIDGRADLYSFGIVLYEMLTGVPPFQADTPHAFLIMHAQERPRALREANPSVAAPPELEALIFRALEKDRSRRFATAREFAQALDAIAPLLSDAWGAPPPLPSEAEITDDATRAAPRVSANAPTVVSIAADAPTVAATEPLPGGRAAEQPLRRIAEPPVEAQPRARGWIAVAVLILSAGGFGVWFYLHKATVITPTLSIPRAAAAAVIPAAQGHLGINAWPWATVTAVRNLDSGENVEIGEMVTPAPLELAPGRYEIRLVNPQFPQPILRTVVVTPGGDSTISVQFGDAAHAEIPDFGATR